MVTLCSVGRSSPTWGLVSRPSRSPGSCSESPRANLLVIREDAATLPVVKRFAAWVRKEAAATAADLKAYAPA